ncbi:hypothetical protein D516_3794 [Rhodobacter sp. AKP1]|nr:hypothetical protein D516_3794 [Rhodobacter sp. AKP1]
MGIGGLDRAHGCPQERHGHTAPVLGIFLVPAMERPPSQGYECRKGGMQDRPGRRAGRRWISTSVFPR